MKRHIVKQSDLNGDIKHFPIEVVQKMVDYQVAQGNKAAPGVFANAIDCGVTEGGFNWTDTTMGYDWWSSIIDSRDFYSYFKEYPRETSSTENNKILLAALMRIAEISDNDTLSVFGSDINIESKIAELVADFPTNVQVTARVELEVGEKSGQISVRDLLSIKDGKISIHKYTDGKKSGDSLSYGVKLSYELI